MTMSLEFLLPKPCARRCEKRLSGIRFGILYKVL